MLEEPNSCILAKVWFYVIMPLGSRIPLPGRAVKELLPLRFAAVANLTSFILPETATWIFEQIWGHSHHEKHKARCLVTCPAGRFCDP